MVALFVLDGTRADYLDTYADVLPTLSRLRREGAWFGNAHVTSVPTLTAVGHANLGTGAEPRVHGLVVNKLFNRVSGKSQEAYDGLNPGEMMALTLADVWNIETEGRAVIIGQGGAIRATAGLVGHGACVLNGRRVFAASYTTRDAGWETNPACYAMSEALKPINARTYWEEAGSWMGHDIADATKFRHSAVFQRFEGDALAAVLEHEAIGADDVTDLVFVNLKGPDYVGHAYGPASPEIKEALAELDRQLARALAIIARKARRRPHRRGLHGRPRHARRTPPGGPPLHGRDQRADRQAFLAVRRDRRAVLQRRGQQRDLSRHGQARLAGGRLEGRGVVPRVTGVFRRGLHRGRGAPRASGSAAARAVSRASQRRRR